MICTGRGDWTFALCSNCTRVTQMLTDNSFVPYNKQKLAQKMPCFEHFLKQGLGLNLRNPTCGERQPRQWARFAVR